MLHQIIDQQNQGLTVAAFEHPHDWQAQSQVVWNFQHISNPVSIYVVTFNPNRSESFEFLPITTFYWLEPNYGFDAVGQNKFGATCLPPMSGIDALVRCAIPKYRGNRQNLHIVGVQAIPNLAQMVNADEMQNTPHEGVSARIEYVENGRVFEEEFYACRFLMTAPASGVTQINWGLARLFCFRAERGRLDAMRQTFWQIACSWQSNRQWQQRFDQIVRQLNGQFEQHIQAVQMKQQAEAQMGQQLNAFYREQNDQRQQQQNAAWAAEQQKNQPEQSTYTVQDAWRDELGGAAAYQDPNSQYGNYHYDYEHSENVWTDGQGGWKTSPDPTYDPNIGSNQNWTRAKKA